MSWAYPTRLDFEQPLYNHCLALHEDTLYGVSLVYPDSLQNGGLVAYRHGKDPFYFAEAEPGVVRRSDMHTRCWVEPSGKLHVIWPGFGENDSFSFCGPSVPAIACILIICCMYILSAYP